MRRMLRLLQRFGFPGTPTGTGIVFGQSGWASDGDTAARFNS